MKHNQLLLEQFIKSKVEGVQLTDNAIVSVYTEFSRKLCNTRLNEFLDAHRQTLAHKKESDTNWSELEGQFASTC